MHTDTERDQHNCIYYWGGRLGREIKRKALRPLHPALEKFKVEPGHPSYPGSGLRATADLPAGTVIGDYAGVWIPDQVLVDSTPYSFGVGVNSAVDALNYGNLTRYMNDPRGTGREANVKPKEVELRAGKTRLLTVRFTTTRAIEKGEELLLFYGYLYDMTLKIATWSSEPGMVIDVDAIPVPVKKEPQSGEKRARDDGGDNDCETEIAEFGRERRLVEMKQDEAVSPSVIVDRRSVARVSYFIFLWKILRSDGWTSMSTWTRTLVTGELLSCGPWSTQEQALIEEMTLTRDETTGASFCCRCNHCFETAQGEQDASLQMSRSMCLECKVFEERQWE